MPAPKAKRATASRAKAQTAPVSGAGSTSTSPSAPGRAPLVLVCGEDDFAAKKRARELFLEWSTELGGMDHETLDGSAANVGEALGVLRKLREALQTLPFFGSAKVVWLKNCNFLGEERAASAADVTEALADLSQELKAFVWQNVRLLISAGKVDKRKTFYKTIEKIGRVENFAGLGQDKDWTDQAEIMATKALSARGKLISTEALAELVARVGPNARLLDSECEKLALYVAERKEIEYEDVAAICTRNKQARAFALGDALGDRHLPRLLRCLDEELWEAKFDKEKSEIGILYGLISKVRALILLKEMLAEGWVKPNMDYYRFKEQLGRVPADQLPSDKRFNPLAINPYVLYKALPQAKNYSQAELIRAMELLFQCNRRLVSSGLDAALVLQQALVQIVSPAGGQPAATGAALSAAA